MIKTPVFAGARHTVALVCAANKASDVTLLITKKRYISSSAALDPARCGRLAPVPSNPGAVKWLFTMGEMCRGFLSFLEARKTTAIFAYWYSVP
jgi:hypothetical protein